MATILITGGTGLVGKQLTKKLISDGNTVRIFSRSKKQKKQDIEFYQWNVKEQIIDENAVKGIDCIIHLAGAGVADKPWTPLYKKEIVRSRVDSIQLIYKKCKELNSFPKSVISASGTAFYGFDNSSKVFSEEESAGEGFLTEVSKKWEEASAVFENENVRRVIYRIGVVLSKEGGALPQLQLPFKFGVGSPMGSGKQPLPWIHIEDLTNAILKAVKNEAYHGTFNAVAPEPLTNAQFSKILAKKMKSPYWAPNVPAFVLHLILGKEKANEMLLNGAHVSSEKLKKSGFEFKYPSLGLALEGLLGA